MKENRFHTKKRVGIWIRVSTDEQAQTDSPKHHELRARGYAESKGWDVVEVYDLSGTSGKSVMETPQAKRMMRDIERKHISGLIFSKLARLARSTMELLSFSDFFQKHGADFISLQEEIDTSTPAGRLFFTVHASLAQFEREEIASRVAASVPIRAKLGKPLGGAGTFGYHWKDKKLVPHPEEAPVRKLIYELFAQHKRARTVAQILNEKGYRTRNGSKFSNTTVARLIMDPTAKGEHRLNYTKSLGNGKQWALKPEHEWSVAPVEPVVSVELWDTCNALFEARKVRGVRPVKRGKTPFTGLVLCHCGKKMSVPSNTPKWVCQACKNKIPAVDLDALFRDQLEGFMMSPERVSEYLASSQNDIADKETLLANARRDRDRLKAEADRCFELYEAKALTPEQFKERYQPLHARKQDIEREIPRLEAEIDSLAVKEMSCERIASEGKSFCAEWPKMDIDRKRAVVELFLESIVIGKDDVCINLFNLPVFRNND